MAARHNEYATAHSGDSLEALTATLTADLRKNIKNLQISRILSPPWREGGQSLHRVGRVTNMVREDASCCCELLRHWHVTFQEKQLPKADHSTLWEGEELALRYLLEDGKLNLCLRLLDDFTKCMLLTASPAYFQSASVEPTLTDGSKAANVIVMSSADLVSLENFEFGTCTTLHNVWQHSEAVQTTDLPLLLGVIKRMLLAHENASALALRHSSSLQAFCSAHGSAESASEGKTATAAAPAEATGGVANLKVDLELEDSTCAFAHLFLGDLGRQLPELGLQLDSIWNNLQRGNVLGAWVAAVLANPMDLPDNILLAGARGVAGLVHCEEFAMRRDAVLSAPLPPLAPKQGAGEDSESKVQDDTCTVLQGIALLTDSILPRLGTSAAVKKSIRPLLDLAAFCKRQASKAKK